MCFPSNILPLKEKYEKLMAEIGLHDRLYYKENRPKISDFEYDCLCAEAERMRQILEANAVATDVAAIGDDRVSGFQPAPHLSPMMSLANTYSRDEVFQFDNRVKAMLGHRKFSYVVEPKIDGIAINLIYKNGKIFRALTRGDGTIGDDVTDNIRTIKNCPEKIATQADTVEIRGEVYIGAQTFLEINKSREEQGLEPFANPRNLAAGTIKTIHGREIFERNLQLITYAIGYCSETVAGLQSEALEYLKACGFRSQEKYWVAENIDEAWRCIGKLDGIRRDFSYWTDGAVLKVNELPLHKNLGATAKSPRWAIAYKFAPACAVTRIRNIILQVGRTGVVTPVAELDPVQLSGTNVSRATLHNASDMEEKDIRIGDYVTVEKAGEIIPAIVAVAKDRRDPESKPFVFPTGCPACGSPLIRLQGEVAWRCQNSCCLPQICRRIEHFVSKMAMDIEGLGSAVVERLVAAKKLNSVADIYTLTFEDMVGLEKLGPKSALKILNNIDGSKTRPLWRFLHGLGILGIGEQGAKVLAKHFHLLENLIAATSEKLETLNGIGAKLSMAVVAFFSETHNVQVIGRLEALGLRCEDEDPTVTLERHGKFHMKNFAITGTLGSMSRHEAKKKIESLGGNVADSISKKTHVLIVGNGEGLKLEKAQSLGIEIWNEENFIGNLGEI
jgi:DNA ligase (NAD+)